MTVILASEACDNPNSWACTFSSMSVGGGIGFAAACLFGIALVIALAVVMIRVFG